VSPDEVPEDPPEELLGDPLVVPPDEGEAGEVGEGVVVPSSNRSDVSAILYRTTSPDLRVASTVNPSGYSPPAFEKR
jgi:hypothetical protein